jgi:hypothetical protein
MNKKIEDDDINKQVWRSHLDRGALLLVNRAALLLLHSAALRLVPRKYIKNLHRNV